MNVLMVGNGKGSWEMRGKQLGAAIGARVTTMPSDDDWRWADVAVLVKRQAVAFAQMARSFNVPIVWDALDFWSQPRENGVTPDHAKRLLRGQLAVIQPALTIGATTAMAEACGGVYLPHHSWSGLVPTSARETVRIVAYQGNPIYLGTWAPALQQACTRRGWQVLVNPVDLSAADIIVALRDGPWDGWICREWKSGVKLVNAIAAGRPVITQASAAWRELEPHLFPDAAFDTSTGSIVETVDDIENALEVWTGREARQAVADQALTTAPIYRLEHIAKVYSDVLQGVAVPA